MATAAPIEDVDLEEDRPPVRTRKANLGASILLSAVEDYRFGNEQFHNSARLFLFPEKESYRRHLGWAVGMTEWTMIWLRETLDRERPKWDRDRKRK